MEIAGLAVGAISMVTAWNTCVQAFDTIGSVGTFGLDHQIIQVKLEVERVRLLAWGEMVGLATVRPGQADPDRIVDQRLNREEMRETVLKLLGCIQNVFNDTDSLQRKYDLKQEPSAAAGTFSSPTTTSDGGQIVLKSIFKRAYINLQNSAREYQQNTPLKLKARWAIGDKMKFLDLISEIRGFNDSLVSLFPDITSKTATQLREDIDASEEISSLQLLEQASVEGHDDIWESTSMRLSNLGQTVTGSSVVPLEDDKTERASVTQGLGNDDGSNTRKDDLGQPLTQAAERELTELEKQLKAINSFCRKKMIGAIRCGLVIGGFSRPSAYVDWEGDTRDRGFRHWDDERKGFVPSAHDAFAIYRRKKFIKNNRNDDYDIRDDEDHVLLDIEADRKYHNVRPGTITVEGFGLEMWDYDAKFGKPRDERILVNTTYLPGIPAKKILRRIDELKSPGTLGWNSTRDMEDIREFTHKGFGATYDVSYQERWGLFSDFYMMLNRSDLFLSFASSASIMLAATGPNSKGIWNFLWQVILGKELARRLERFPDASISGFTTKVLTTLIVADQWIHNIDLVLIDKKESAEETEARKKTKKKAAESLKDKGNEAMKTKKYKTAIDFYSEALEIDPENPVLLSNRAAAYISIQEYQLACDDAQAAVDADPTFTKAWGRLGLAKLELGDIKGSMEAYKQGIDSDSTGGSAIMKQGYENARKKLTSLSEGSEANTPTEASPDGVAKGKEKKSGASKKNKSAPWDDAWDLEGKSLEWHSLVHEKQVEGLLRFAEILKWPFMNETRDFAEDVYSNIRGGNTVPPDIWDWIYGMSLPGKWAAYKIFAMLVLSTPSLAKELGTAHYFDHGLSLPKQSYWRSRTVLGRVLGGLPGVKFACGWIGPCPPIESPHRKYIRLKARWVAPPRKDGNITWIGPFESDDGDETTHLREGEDIQQWMAEIRDESSWAIPQPPVRQMTTCSVVSIRVKKLPLNTSFAAKSNKMSEAEIDDETEYRASVEFKIDNEPPVKYTLYTNPVFVTLPACKGPAHPVHMRELPKFRRNILNVEELKEAEAADYEENGLIVINATGRGAETVARAWCSERGRNAVIRANGGPCFVCAYDAASRKGLAVGVLIWVGDKAV
ncbi:hypothetical protein M408DRAFT_29056 [Serendipita vermifera MAFF 305830]|uniref:Prion-inhibition and propagation HeLo domain-containing protein n=1 Tax=Serendipita vermifera MAFF 305830 TaxID=933852 RepID=A0A0C3APR2_SERVB|nr:hypothetical protein M408DRAFT_29056 [Serendipita vermifera MAFF 305830]